MYALQAGEGKSLPLWQCGDINFHQQLKCVIEADSCVSCLKYGLICSNSNGNKTGISRSNRKSTSTSLLDDITTWSMNKTHETNLSSTSDTSTFQAYNSPFPDDILFGRPPPSNNTGHDSTQAASDKGESLLDSSTPKD
jgi:hypothetical protein